MKPELSSADGTKISTNEEVGADAQENFDQGVSLGETSFEMPNEPSSIAIGLPQTLKYDCGSPDCDATPCVIETTCVSNTSLAIVPFVQEASEKGLSDGVEVGCTFQVEQKRDTIGSEWESLISDTSDILIFNSPNDSEAFRGVIQKSLDPGVLISQFSQDDINEACETTVDLDKYKDQTEGAGEMNKMNPVNESFVDAGVTNFISGSLTDYMETHMSAPYSFKVKDAVINNIR